MTLKPTMERHPFYSLKRVAEMLRHANKHFDGPGIALVVDQRGVITGDLEDSHEPWQYSSEVPGDDRPFDALAEARRLLAAWRDRRQ
jgi:hypothetical protein